MPLVWTLSRILDLAELFQGLQSLLPFEERAETLGKPGSDVLCRVILLNAVVRLCSIGARTRISFRYLANCITGSYLYRFFRHFSPPFRK